MSERYSDEYDRSVGGLDFDGDIRERASDLGSRLAEQGPGALLDQVEELIPDAWKEHIAAFPLTAIVLGFGAGIFLGLKKGDEIISAGSSLLAAAAAANMNAVLSGVRGAESDSE